MALRRVTLPFDLSAQDVPDVSTMTSGLGWNQLAMSATMSVGTQTKPPE